MNDDVLLALQRATHVTLHALSTRLSDEGLVPGEFHVLANLDAGEGMAVGELGAAVGSKPTTLTSILDRLERKGLLERHRDTEDRRVVLVQLTAEGEAVAERVRAAYAEVGSALVLDPSAVSLRDGLEGLAAGGAR